MVTRSDNESNPPATRDQRTVPLNASRVSSPTATGGAGTFFEQHVAVYWLAQLLVRSIPPILHDCTVTEVHLQTEHLGWNTDDFLIVGQNGSGDSRKLAGQVKRSFTVSAADEECNKTMRDFWRDFKNPQQFSVATDRLVLVTLRGTNTLLEHFSGLLDCSRAARDGAEFERRLATSGFINARAIHYCEEIRKIIGEVEGRSISTVEVWPFLRVLHVLSLDLNSATRQSEAMIKSLLAYTTSDQDARSAAEASWNALLREVSEGMPRARSFRHDDLPETLRQRHAVIGGSERSVLRALNEHSKLILDGIRSTIGDDLHLTRGRLVQQVIEQLESTQVVLITGVAGSGKSVVAKDAIEVIAADHFAFSFRAEEFAHPHFDETLRSNQIPANAAMLGALLASQNRKVLLVESVERLLEKSTRDAFTDLLTLVARDNGWRLVLTCRDYSTDLVRSCFLAYASVSHSVVTVPPLSDEELEEVKAAHPALARPLGNAALRQILRNPYLLDKALQIRWSEERSLPESEREFRALFWREIVRADHRALGGMPRRREVAFVQIALQRARSLTLYIAYSDLDPEAVDVLHRDSLIVTSPQSSSLVAPAHDVLEDWAILQWIEEQSVIHDGSVRDLSAAVGTHPAVRRTFRNWVTELVERDPAAADGLFQAAMRDGGLPAQFRDDTLVALLRSPSSSEFLDRHSSELFANDKRLLRRVIHLLRVACVTTPNWLGTSAAQASVFDVPDGPAWACVLRLVQTHLQSFAEEDRPLLLGLIEDWARGVSWQEPYPKGASSVAAIAYWLLPSFNDYRSEDRLKRTLQVIAKIPKADPESFVSLMRGRADNEERDRKAEIFREIIFEGLEGASAARDIPELFASTAEEYLLYSEADLRRKRSYASARELATLFGIKPGRRGDFFPASAYRGPYLQFLRYHHRQGLDFIIDVFNHSADWYARPRIRSKYVEPPFEMTLTFADGSTRTQWSNARLWNLYRGTSVGPYLLQSLLMALERWLLEFAEGRPQELDAILLDILQRSDSAALTSVVASIATAFPHASGETLLVLLRSPLCILLDRQRLKNEVQAPSTLSEVLPQFDVRNEVYEAERKQADARPHRSRELVTAIANLQLGSLASQVHEILDRHRAELPPADEQSERDHMWRLILHEMDLRQYTVADDAIDTPTVPAGQASLEDGRRYVHLKPKELEPDIKEIVEQKVARSQIARTRLGLLAWGLEVFGQEEDAEYDPAQWKQRLQEARTLGTENDGDEDNGLSRDGPGFVAAVCIRDHWEEMSDVEQEWCVDVVCSEVEREGNHWNRFVREQRNRMSADRPCAWVLPLLLGKPLNDTHDYRVRDTLVTALTHPISEVRWYAASGIGKHLWTIDRELTLRCVNALATEANVVQQVQDAESDRIHGKRRGVDEIVASAAAYVRQHFFETRVISEHSYQSLDPTTWFGAETNRLILTILSQVPTEAVAITAFERLARTLVGWWNADDDWRRNKLQERSRRDYQTEAALQQLLEYFLLHTKTVDAIRISKPIVDAIDSHPDKVRWILIGLIGAEDRQPNPAQFWTLWKQFSDGVRRAKWVARIDGEHASGSEMIYAIFLGTRWKDEVRHWRSLEGHAEHIHTLFEDLPACSTVLDGYLRFLYHVGEQSLPAAFIRIDQSLQQGDRRQMLRKGNTIFILERLLQRYVYGKPLELKSRRDLRDSVLVLLDLLVEHGSSAAFRMRDDFVTPVSIT